MTADTEYLSSSWTDSWNVIVQKDAGRI